MKTQNPEELIKDGIDAYAILGLNPSTNALFNGSHNSVSKAYAEAIRNAGENEVKISEINTALSILQNPRLKTLHDEALGYGEKWRRTINTSQLRAITDKEFASRGVKSAQPEVPINPNLLQEVEAEQKAARLRAHEAMRKRKSPTIIVNKREESSPVTVTSPQEITKPQHNPNILRQGLQKKSAQNLTSSGNAKLKHESLTRSLSDPTHDRRHLSGDDLKQAILNNRTKWQKFTASWRGQTNELTENEKEGHRRLEEAQSVIIGDVKSNQVIKDTLQNVRQNRNGRSISI